MMRGVEKIGERGNKLSEGIASSTPNTIPKQ
jgi:hypothetical protein